MPCAGRLRPVRLVVGESSSLHGWKEREAELLLEAYAKPLLLHASHQGPSVMLSHLQTSMYLIWPKPSLCLQSMHRLLTATAL